MDFFFLLGYKQITEVYCTKYYLPLRNFGSFVLMILKRYSKQNKKNGLQKNQSIIHALKKNKIYLTFKHKN